MTLFMFVVGAACLLAGTFLLAWEAGLACFGLLLMVAAADLTRGDR